MQGFFAVPFVEVDFIDDVYGLLGLEGAERACHFESDGWHELVAINDVPSEQIVAFSRETYKDLWKDRFEDDLVAVMAQMGREPGRRVRLTLRSSGRLQVLERIPMTEKNRKALTWARVGHLPQDQRQGFQ